MNQLWAVLPVKGFARAKSRLGEVLSDPVRTAFARSLFEHVLGTLQATPSVKGVLVLTEDDEVAQLSRASGAQVLRDQPGHALAQVIDAGLSRVGELGADAALVCMADLPHVQRVEIEQVLAVVREGSLVIAPDAQDAGTNVLALAPPLLLATCFGRADSFQQHLARAQEYGHAVHVVRAPGLCFDVDGPQDLGELSPEE